MLPAKLKVAIVHDFLLKLGGAEYLLLEILKIFPEADIFTLFYDPKGTDGLFSNHKVTFSKLQSNSIKPPPNFKLLLPKLPQAIENFDFSEYDLVISHSNSFAHGVITGPKTKHICYCLSPTRYLYDWKNEYLLENHLFRGIKSVVVKKILSDLRLWDQQAATRPDHYIAISDHVRQRIRKYYRLNADVIYPAVDVKSIIPNYGKREDFYIIISRLTPYKKIDLAITAFNRFGKNLVIVGTGEDQARLKKMSKSNIEFLGWQSRASLFEYLRNARALIFPGEEDFGLTPVEAMACGTPVIAYSYGGVTETVIDGKTGLFFDQPDAQSLQSAIDRLEENFSSFKPAEIRKQAEKFSFERFKEEFLDIIDQYNDQKY